MKTVLMNVKGSLRILVRLINCMWTINTYEDNRDNREDHDCFALLFSCKGLVPSDSCLKNVCLLLFEIQKIFELNYIIDQYFSNPMMGGLQCRRLAMPEHACAQHAGHAFRFVGGN